MCLILQDFTEGYKGFSALQVVQMEKTQSTLSEWLALMVSQSQELVEQRIIMDTFQLQRVAVTSVWHPQ